VQETKELYIQKHNYLERTDISILQFFL